MNPTDEQLNAAEAALFDQLTDARRRVGTRGPAAEDVRCAAIVAHLAAALASLRSIPRGAK